MKSIDIREKGTVGREQGIVITSDFKMNIIVLKMNDGWGLNNGEVRYTHNTSAGLLLVRFLKSYLLKQRKVKEVGQRDGTHNIRNS